MSKSVTLTNLDDYHLIIYSQKWFQGRAYLDKRRQIFPWQLVILEQFISGVVMKSVQAAGMSLNFHIIITGSKDESEFCVDLFAFINGMSLNSQNIFTNPFSALHWGLSTLFVTIYKLYPHIFKRLPLTESGAEWTECGDVSDDDIITETDEPLPGELGGNGHDQEEKTVIH